MTNPFEEETDQAKEALGLGGEEGLDAAKRSGGDVEVGGSGKESGGDVESGGDIESGGDVESRR